jgi:hypothetical protein
MGVRGCARGKGVHSCVVHIRMSSTSTTASNSGPACATHAAAARSLVISTMRAWRRVIGSCSLIRYPSPASLPRPSPTALSIIPLPEPCSFGQPFDPAPRPSVRSYASDGNGRSSEALERSPSSSERLRALERLTQVISYIGKLPVACCSLCAAHQQPARAARASPAVAPCLPGPQPS